MTRIISGVLVLLSLVLLGGQWLDPVPFDYAAALGRNGASTVNKFGQAIDADTDEMTIWEGPSVGGPDRAFANQSGTFTLYASSDDAADTMDLEVQGLDASWAVKTTTVTLAGTTKTAVSGTWERVFRAKPASDLAGTVYLYIDDTVTSGVPDTPLTKLVTIVTAAENQTMMNAYTVPEGFSYLLSSWCVSNLGSPQASTKTFRLRTTYPQGTASRTQQVMEYADGTSGCHPVNPPIRFRSQADIELTVESASATGTQPVTGHFDGVLIPD